MPIDSNHYAKEAARLLADDTLKHALDTLRAEALEALVQANVETPQMIIRLQEKVAVIDGIRSELESAVLRTATANSSTGTFA